MSIYGKFMSDQEKMAHRQIRVAEYYLKGEPIHKICFLLGCSDRTIRRDLDAIREEWRAARVGFTERAIVEQLEKIDLLEREAWDAWLRSCKPIKTTEITEDKKGYTTTKITRRESAGDAGFLAIVDEQIKSRRKLLGLDAPVKTESSVSATLTHTYEQPKTREQMIDAIRERLRAGCNN